MNMQQPIMVHDQAMKNQPKESQGDAFNMVVFNFQDRANEKAKTLMENFREYLVWENLKFALMNLMTIVMVGVSLRIHDLNDEEQTVHYMVLYFVSAIVFIFGLLSYYKLNNAASGYVSLVACLFHGCVAVWTFFTFVTRFAVIGNAQDAVDFVVALLFMLWFAFVSIRYFSYQHALLFGVFLEMLQENEEEEKRDFIEI